MGKLGQRRGIRTHGGLDGYWCGRAGVKGADWMSGSGSEESREIAHVWVPYAGESSAVDGAGRRDLERRRERPYAAAASRAGIDLEPACCPCEQRAPRPMCALPIQSCSPAAALLSSPPCASCATRPPPAQSPLSPHRSDTPTLRLLDIRICSSCSICYSQGGA